jgi:hypothetical protein
MLMCHDECDGTPQCTRPRYVSCPPDSAREKVHAYNSNLALGTSVARVDLLAESDLIPTVVVRESYRSAMAMSLTPSSLESAQSWKSPSPRRMNPVGIVSPSHFECTAPGLVTANWRDPTPPWEIRNGEKWTSIPEPPNALRWRSWDHRATASSLPGQRRRIAHGMQTRSKSRSTRAPALVELDDSGRKARSQHRPRRMAVERETRVSKPAAARKKRIKR